MFQTDEFGAFHNFPSVLLRSEPPYTVICVAAITCLKPKKRLIKMMELLTNSDGVKMSWWKRSCTRRYINASKTCHLLLNSIFSKDKFKTQHARTKLKILANLKKLLQKKKKKNLPIVARTQ